MKKTSIKNIIMIVVGVGALLLLYVLFVKPDGGEQAGSPSLASSTTGNSPIQAQTNQASSTSAGDSLLRILNSLEGLELNDSIFFNPAFQELTDISIPLVKEGNAGRRNPFAPIGNDPVPVPVNNGSVGNAGASSTSDDTQNTEDTPQASSMFGS
jgi:hypothetical protein